MCNIELLILWGYDWDLIMTMLSLSGIEFQGSWSQFRMKDITGMILCPATNIL